MTWCWDVKNTLTPPMADNESIRSVNLMCFLLHNISYSELYDGPLENVVTRLWINLDRFPRDLQVDADGNPYDVKTALEAVLQGIATRLSTPPIPSGLKLRHYFERRTPPAAPGDTMHDVADLLNNMPVQMRHFCRPFLAFYYDSNMHIEPRRMDEFIQILGPFTLWDFYTLSDSSGRYGAQKSEIQRAQNDRILLFTFDARPGLTITTTPPRNGKRCNSSNRCENGALTDWCNEDENGHCTIGS